MVCNVAWTYSHAFALFLSEPRFPDPSEGLSLRSGGYGSTRLRAAACRWDKPDILECDVGVFCVDRVIACSRRYTALSFCSPRFRICPPLIAALKKGLNLSMINFRRADFTPILYSRTYFSSPGRLISLRLRLSSTVSCSIMT